MSGCARRWRRDGDERAAYLAALVGVAVVAGATPTSISLAFMDLSLSMLAVTTTRVPGLICSTLIACLALIFVSLVTWMVTSFPVVSFTTTLSAAADETVPITL